MHIPKPLASPQVLTNSAKSALLAQKSTLFMEKTPSSQEKIKRLLPTFFCTYCQKFNLGIKLSGWSFVYIKEVDIKKALLATLNCHGAEE